MKRKISNIKIAWLLTGIFISLEITVLSHNVNCDHEIHSCRHTDDGCASECPICAFLQISYIPSTFTNIECTGHNFIVRPLPFYKENPYISYQNSNQLRAPPCYD